MKNSLITHLSSLIMLMAAMLLIASCRSQKKVVKSEVAIADTCSVSSLSTTAVERLRWMDSISLHFDSLELEWRVPADHFAEIGNMVGDTAQNSLWSPSMAEKGNVAKGLYTLPFNPYAASGARLTLRARHASLGKVGRLERGSSSHAQQADSVMHHRTSASDMKTDNDTTAIAKPPDLEWLTFAIIAGLVVVFIIIFWIEYE